MVKALALFSGGLDSILATCIIRNQAIYVEAVNFKTPFFGPDRAIKAAKGMDIPLRILDITPVFLEMLYEPRHGYGSCMNPCIDCHILMLQQTGKIMEREGFNFIFTGEVLGQRPMSQSKGMLKHIARESGYDGYILRPLSARLLPETVPELREQVDRSEFLDIQGRSRKRQMILARMHKITDYPSPAGGCLLTDPAFSKRLKDLFRYQKDDIEVRDMELLKWGRHLRLDEKTKLIVGRNKKENEAIYGLSKPQDQLLKVMNLPGPVVLIPFGVCSEKEDLAASICASYSDASDNKPVRIMITQNHNHRIIYAGAINKDCFKDLII